MASVFYRRKDGGVPIVGPTWGWDHEIWKDLCGTTMRIKFVLNTMPLNPSSMTHKFNGFVLKKKFNPPSNGPVHPDRCHTSGLVTIGGVPICARFEWVARCALLIVLMEAQWKLVLILLFLENDYVHQVLEIEPYNEFFSSLIRHQGISLSTGINPLYSYVGWEHV